MKLVYIHGVGNAGETADGLTADWSAALVAGGVDAVRLAAANPEMAYYADLLSAGKALAPLENLLPDVEKVAFIADAMLEIIAAMPNLHAQGPGDARTAEKILSAEIGAINATFVRDVLDETYDYLTKAPLRRRIDDAVRPLLSGAAPKIVIAHSLGSVVAYRLLREMDSLGLPCGVVQLISVGSPLASRTIQRTMGPPLVFPESTVGAWRNHHAAGDPITFGKPLTAVTFIGGISNARVSNPLALHHLVRGYLDNVSLAATVGALL